MKKITKSAILRFKADFLYEVVVNDVQKIFVLKLGIY